MLEQYVDHDFFAPIRSLLDDRFVLTVFSARFVPGLRLPTYTASGFFGTSFSTFVSTIITATAIWTTILFSAAYWFGNVTDAWLGSVRIWVACFLVLILLLVMLHNIRAYRAKRTKLKLRRQRA